MSSPLPVGVFDSGVGGVSVLRAIRQLLPQEHLIYVADSRHAPYGNRSPEFVTERATTLIHYFVERSAKAVVVACNTATGIAVGTLRQRFPDLPFVAIEPALKPAVATSSTGVVGILATRGTLTSEKFKRLADVHGQRGTIVTQVGIGLVEQVERGELNGAATRALVENALNPLLSAGADTIVLGCTHYPFLTPVIQEVAGPAVTLIDPAVAVARELGRRLETRSMRREDQERGAIEFLTSGTPEDVRDVLERLWPDRVEVAALPDRFR
jgi:glutamate racemase